MSYLNQCPPPTSSHPSGFYSCYSITTCLKVLIPLENNTLFYLTIILERSESGQGGRDSEFIEYIQVASHQEGAKDSKQPVCLDQNRLSAANKTSPLSAGKFYSIFFNLHSLSLYTEFNAKGLPPKLLFLEILLSTKIGTLCSQGFFLFLTKSTPFITPFITLFITLFVTPFVTYLVRQLEASEYMSFLIHKYVECGLSLCKPSPLLPSPLQSAPFCIPLFCIPVSPTND